MDTIQKVYRTELPEGELNIWCETLKEYSFQEFELAMKDLIRHPPKYELEDGSIQVWRGMPKLPDVIHTMLENRDKTAFNKKKEKQKQEDLKQKELEKYREEHPEEFLTWADVIKAASEHSPQVKALAEQLDPRKPDKRTSKILPVLDDIQYRKRQDELEEQKKKLLAEDKQ